MKCFVNEYVELLRVAESTPVFERVLDLVKASVSESDWDKIINAALGVKDGH